MPSAVPAHEAECPLDESEEGISDDAPQQRPGVRRWRQRGAAGSSCAQEEVVVAEDGQLEVSKKTEVIVRANQFHHEILTSNAAVQAIPFELAVGAVRFAEELFRPRTQQLSYDRRGDMSLLGETRVVQTTAKLRRDFEVIAQGNALYWPECMCQNRDMAFFNALYEELSPWVASIYRRSRHPACVDEVLLLQSPTYRRIAAILCKTFDFHIGYSIVNLYANGDDWTEYHRDNYRAEGNRMASTSADETPTTHNATIGVSFGAPRELRFKHLQTQLEFGFPQGNGDVFAFTEPVNSAFQHCIPQCGRTAAGPRISVILWGRTGTPNTLRPLHSKFASTGDVGGDRLRP